MEYEPSLISLKKQVVCNNTAKLCKLPCYTYQTDSLRETGNCQKISKSRHSMLLDYGLEPQDPDNNSLFLDYHFHRLLFQVDVLSFEGFIGFGLCFCCCSSSFVYIWYAVFRLVGNGMKNNLN